MARTKTVTSKENPTVKALRALVAKPYEPRRQNRAVVDGPHLLQTYLERVGLPELVVVSAAAAGNAEVDRLRQAAATIDTLVVPDGLFRELSGTVNPVGILAVISIPPAPTGPLCGPCVLLDAVQDAGNVGTIIRTAAAAGIDEVVLGPGCAGAWTAKVVRAAQGAHFGLRLREQADLAALIEAYDGLCVATVAHGGTPLYQLDLSGNVAWIFGNEGSGMSAALTARTSRQATIPLAPGNESLNVGAAAAICLFEARRQLSIKRGRYE